MPLPSRFQFDDRALGLPPQPVPIRYACRAADWSLSLLAELVTGFGPQSAPLLAVYEFSVASGVARVSPDTYQEFRGLRTLGPEALAKLPANHFVWSDDLVLAFSDVVDMTTGREEAHAQKQYINWDPDPGECAAVISESADFSRCPPRWTVCSLRQVHGVWHVVFEGNKCAYGDEKGFEYLQRLLIRRKPGVDNAFSIEEFDALVNRQPASFVGPSAAKESVQDDLTTDGAVTERSTVDAPLVAADDRSLRVAERLLNQLREDLAAAKDLKDLARQDKLEDQIERTERYLSANRGLKGRARQIGGTEEKKRKAISAAITRAIESIDRQQPDLAAHLRRHVHTGRTFAYRPPPSIIWNL